MIPTEANVTYIFSIPYIFTEYVVSYSLIVSNHPDFWQHAFDVVRVAGSSATNFVNPVRRDVVSIGNSSTDNVTIRFTTNDPGPWFLHW